MKAISSGTAGAGNDGETLPGKRLARRTVRALRFAVCRKPGARSAEGAARYRRIAATKLDFFTG